MALAPWQIIPNPWLLRRLPGVSGMALYPFVLTACRPLAPGETPPTGHREVVHAGQRFAVSERLLRHEQIHLKQQAEMLVLPFYAWYVAEYLVRRVGSAHTQAYAAIGFEREAYTQEANPNYLGTRKPWAFLAYLS